MNRKQSRSISFLIILLSCLMMLCGISLIFTDSASAESGSEETTTTEEADSSSADNPQITEFAIYSGAPGAGGTLVYDVLNPANTPNFKGFDGWNQPEFYLSIEIEKSDVDDSNWVSIQLPWWVNPQNVIQTDDGSSWHTVGASVAGHNTSLDKVLAWQYNSGRPSQNATDSGTITYSIKTGGNLQKAGINMSFKVSGYYKNGNEIETLKADAAQFKVACGRMDGDEIGDTTDSAKTESVQLYTKGTLQGYKLASVVPEVAVGESGTSVSDRWVGRYYGGGMESHRV